MFHCKESRIHLTRAIAASVLTAFASLSYAQETIDTLGKRFITTPDPLSTFKPLLAPLKDQPAPPDAAKISFTLKAIQLTGNTALSSAELETLYRNRIGQKITLDDAYAIRDAITAKYGAAGYGLSKAIIPEQRIDAEEGVLQIQILEGYIDGVTLQAPGQDGKPVEIAPSESYPWLLPYIDKLKAERPIRAATMERYLLLMNDRFSWKVTSTLAPGNEPNASRLILRVEVAAKVEGSLSIDNRGTESVGPEQITASLTLNGLGAQGLGSRAAQTALSYITTPQTSELKYLSLSHTEILTAEGTSINLSYTGSDSEPGAATALALQQESDSTTWSLKLAHPFIRTRQENLTGLIRFDHKDTESRTLGAIASQDKTRVLRTGINYDKADSRAGINQIIAELSLGIAGMGATDNNSTLKSRADGRPDFQKLTLNLSRKQELSYFNQNLNRWSVNAALMAQYAAQGMLSGEECGVGGQQFGRAYDSSELLGDSCTAASLEARYAADTQGSPFEYAQWYGFWDAGQIYNRTPLSATDPQRKSLASAGLGVRFGIGKHVSGSLELAKPLTRDVANEGDRDPRLFASLAAKF